MSSVVREGSPSGRQPHPARAQVPSCAREEWGWRPEWDLSRMTDDMLAHIRAKLGAE